MNCDCPTYQGVTMHFDECPALQAAILKHRQAVESMIRTNMVKHGVSLDQLKTRCELKQYPHKGKLELWIDGKLADEMQDMVRLK